MPRPYIVERLFPAQEVHLIAGTSGAGKTRWIFQHFLSAWLKEQNVLGYRSHPSPWLYLSADRSIESVLETMESSAVPFITRDNISSMLSGKSTISLEGLKKLIATKLPKGGLVIIDGFQSLTPGGKINDYATVSDFLISLTRYCAQTKITIFGICHATKVKRGEEFAHPRNRVLGSTAWAGYADTVVIIDAPDPEKDPNRRDLWIGPRQAAPISLCYEFQKGLLVPADEGLAELLLDEFLSRCDPKSQGGIEITTAQFMEYAQAKSVSRATIYRWIDQAVEAGRMIKSGRGNYMTRAAS